MKKRKLKNGFVKRGQLIFLLSFIFLIAAGTALLEIPGMYRGRLAWIDALFVATSAVCVTGLSTVELTDFTVWGQLVVLVLIQLGGLGIMTLSASILLAVGRAFSFSDALMISSLNDSFSLRGTESLMLTVINYTLIAEAAGFVLMLPGMLIAVDGVWNGIWGALFLSVSSFCNAGFSPVPDSLARVGVWVQFVCLLLMVTGGIGVYVIYDINLRISRLRSNLHVHTKLVLLTTAILLVLGAAGLWLFCWVDARNIGPFDALFSSATARTCGFYTVPPAAMPPTAQALLVFLMLIGGSPGGTAGGIKTSTVALVFAAILSVIRGDSEVLLFNRRIPTMNVLRAFTIILIFTLLGGVGAVFLKTRETTMEFSQITFEAISALTTTGLSIGDTTARLSADGKLFLVFFMFLGRVGPLTVLLFLLGREKHTPIQYPEERIIIG